jgi:hypothetical protein
MYDTLEKRRQDQGCPEVEKRCWIPKSRVRTTSPIKKCGKNRQRTVVFPLEVVGGSSNLFAKMRLETPTLADKKRSGL